MPLMLNTSHSMSPSYMQNFRHASKNLVNSETEPNSDMEILGVVSDNLECAGLLPEKVNNSKTPDGNFLADNFEMQHDNCFGYPELQTSVDDRVEPKVELVDCDTLHNHYIFDSEVISDYQLMDFDIPSDDQFVYSETQEERLPHNHSGNSKAFSFSYRTLSQSMHSEAYLQMAPIETPDNDYGTGLTDTQAIHERAISEVDPNNQEANPKLQQEKPRKKKSDVWLYFSIESVSPGCRRARCKLCRQTFAYSTGPKVAGTSHLKRHITKTCPGKNQGGQNTSLASVNETATGSSIPRKRKRSPVSPYEIFDQVSCRNEIAKMVIIHDYPLQMVEHPGFLNFTQNLQPQFEPFTCTTVQGDCFAIYQLERSKLMNLINGITGRVCLTLEMWTSTQSVGYFFISGHFVDDKWKLQRRILRVVMEPYTDSETALSHAVSACLSDWNLQGRLLSVTSSHPLSEAVEKLRPLLSMKNPQILSGQLLLGHCVAHTFRSVVEDVFSWATDALKKIRECVKYVKMSVSHEKNFHDLKLQLQVPSQKTLCLDDQTQWNTTYQMLIAAWELREVFSCLDTSDPDYKDAPSLEDWKLVETICGYLKPLFDAINIMYSKAQPTAITIFQEIWKFRLDLSRTVINENPLTSSLAKKILVKFDKYWSDCGLVLASAVVMDPRFKMKLVEFSFIKLYDEEAGTYIKVVDDGIHELFQEYALAAKTLGDGIRAKMEESSRGIPLPDNQLTGFDAYIMETDSQRVKSELDQYLAESLLPRAHDFDVLGWWKSNELKYPILSKMARDILSIPVSSVPPDSLFKVGTQEMDRYWSSLQPQTLEALKCTKDWMQYT